MHKNDIDVAISNLAELMSMIEHRSDDMYIASMKQLCVNPLVYLHTENISKAVESAHSTSANSIPKSAPDTIVDGSNGICGYCQRRNSSHCGDCDDGVPGCHYNFLGRILRAGA